MMSFRWEELVGFAATALNIWGNWLLTDKKASGWPVRLVCNGAQLAYGVLIGSMAVSVNALVFAVINCVGMYRWRQTQK